MGLHFDKNSSQYTSREDNPAMVEATQKLWLTATGDDQRLVPDGDPAAAFLFCVPGDMVLRADADRLNMLGDLEVADPPPPPVPADGPVRPSTSATKDEWIAYAKAVDQANEITGADHSVLTKAQLIEAYGSKD